MSVAEFRFEADHPACRGHFPGNPIVPGAVLLDATLQAIETGLDAKISSWSIKSAKFFRPVRPGDTVTFEYIKSGAADFRFTASVAGKTVLAGHLQCDLPPTVA
ncbi:MAG TPA: hypothetical protein VMZ27_00965 [Candidatus Saccharimonadales bacterium]|nr:hypothetical protein [Candidatus Saccharimonadales bacterium]